MATEYADVVGPDDKVPLRLHGGDALCTLFRARLMPASAPPIDCTCFRLTTVPFRLCWAIVIAPMPRVVTTSITMTAVISATPRSSRCRLMRGLMEASRSRDVVAHGRVTAGLLIPAGDGRLSFDVGARVRV